MSLTSPHERVALVIPHLHRHDFLRRMLRYYRWAEFQGGIFIVDCSEDPDGALSVVKEFKNDLKLFLSSVPGWYDPMRGTSFFFQQLAEGGRKAAENGYDFIVHAGNDDFIVPLGLDCCVQHLDAHPEQNLALGTRFGFALHQEGPYGNVISFKKSTYPELHSDKIFVRTLNWFKMPYTLQFAVIRAPVFGEIHNYQTAGYMPTFYVGNELFANLALLCKGPIELVTNSPTIFFQYHRNKPFNWGINAHIVDGVLVDENFSMSWGNLWGLILDRWQASGEMGEDECEDNLRKLLAVHLTQLIQQADMVTVKERPEVENEPRTLPDEAPFREIIQPIFDLLQKQGDFA